MQYFLKNGSSARAWNPGAGSTWITARGPWSGFSSQIRESHKSLCFSHARSWAVVQDVTHSVRTRKHCCFVVFF